MRGTVVNLSATPHRPVGGVPVAVQLRRDGRTLATVQGRADARGNFTLAAPPAPPHAGYAVIAIYRDVPYGVAVTTAQAARPFQVPVYDTTSSDAGLAAMRVVIGLRRTGQGLAVIEQWTFVNAGTRTDVGADAASGRGAVRFPLPPGATHVAIRNLAPPPATATVQHGDVVVNTVVRPATGMNLASFHQVTFTFDVPSGAGHPTLVVPTRFFIGRLVAFTIGSRLFAPGFTKTTVPMGAHAQQVPAVQAQAVPPGSTLAIGVDGPPAVVSVAPSAPAGPTPFPLKTVLILIEAGFGCLLVLGLRRRMTAPAGPAAPRSSGRAESARPRDRLALQRERARLIGAIAELDVQHERGRVVEDEYRRRRAQEKGRLLSVARQLGE